MCFTVKIFVFYQMFPASTYIKHAFDHADIEDICEFLDTVHNLKLNEYYDRLYTKILRILNFIKHLNGLAIQNFDLVDIIFSEACDPFLQNFLLL